MKEVVFLILNYKTYEDTINLCNEILGQQFSFTFSILVVDNKSPNDSFKKIKDEFIENTRVSVIQSPENGGFAKGNNYGLRYLEKMKPNYVCLLNNDVHFTGDTITHLVEMYPCLESPAVIAPVQYLPNGKPARFTGIDELPTFFQLLRQYSIFHDLSPIEYESNTNRKNIRKVAIIPGAFMFAQFDILQSIGFFDEDTFLFGEERLLAAKIALSNLNNYIVLDCTYHHEHSKTINSEASYWSQRKLILHGHLTYIRKYKQNTIFKCIILYMAYWYNKYANTLVIKNYRRFFKK